MAAKKAAGFTLLELIIVIALTGVLISLALPSMQGFLRRSRLETSRQVLLTSLSEARSDARSRRVVRSVFASPNATELRRYECPQVLTAEVEAVTCGECREIDPEPLEDGVTVPNAFAVSFLPPHGDVVIADETAMLGVCLANQAPESEAEALLQVKNDTDPAVTVRVHALSGLIETLDPETDA